MYITYRKKQNSESIKKFMLMFQHFDQTSYLEQTQTGINEYKNFKSESFYGKWIQQKVFYTYLELSDLY